MQAPEEAEGAALVGRMAERWRWRLTRFFSHDLRGRQALILYAAPAHFRQTNAIEGLVGEGTGGATEALKRATGARALRTIIEEVMLDIMYDIPSRRDVKKVIVTAETILFRKEPAIITLNQLKTAS